MRHHDEWTETEGSDVDDDFEGGEAGMDDGWDADVESDFDYDAYIDREFGTPRSTTPRWVRAVVWLLIVSFLATAWLAVRR